LDLGVVVTSEGDAVLRALITDYGADWLKGRDILRGRTRTARGKII
jgi:hypothetical protein